MRALLVLLLFTEALSGQSSENVRSAVNRALPILQRSAGEFVTKRACISCHHNILTVVALDDAIQATTLNDPTPNDNYLLMAAHEAGLPQGLTLAVYAKRLVRWQRDGHWITSDFRPPHSSSFFMATATAVRAVTFYMPEELRTERERAIRSARQWLFENRPVSTEDAAFRLMGLVWAKATEDEIRF